MRFYDNISVDIDSIMNANAAARKRRAGGASFDPAPPTPQQQNIQNQSQNQNKGLTIQQVVVLVDQRLTTLETFMRETKESTGKQVNASTSSIDDEVIAQISNDMNQRFELLATELGELKDVVMKLQSYTMDVNRTLLEQKSIVSSSNSEPAYNTTPSFDYSNVYVGSDMNLN